MLNIFIDFLDADTLVFIPVILLIIIFSGYFIYRSLRRQRESQKKLASLALFPEQNPNPVIELARNGKVTYMNKAAISAFPDLQALGVKHPLFDLYRKITEEGTDKDRKNFGGELHFGEEIYEQKINFIEGGEVARIYSSNITEQKRTEKNLARLASFPEQNPNPVIEVDMEGRITYRNPAALKQFPDLEKTGFAHPVFEMLKQNMELFRSKEMQSLNSELKIGDEIYEQKITFMPGNNIIRLYSSDITERKKTEEIIRQKNDQLNNALALLTEEKKVVEQKSRDLEQALNELKKTQTQLVQAEKMASLGQLTAGVAHEINNPVNFISANINPLQRDIADLLEVLKKYEEVIAEKGLSKEFDKVEAYKKEMDIPLVLDEIEKLVKGIEVGAIRTTEIVKGLRNFSRLDESDLKKADLNEGLESTLVLLHNKYKDRIEIVKEFGNIPQIECFPGQLNQVFMNIIANAVDAIRGQGKIIIKTQHADTNVIVSIKDTGTGMPDNMKKKIFDPFFTTKDVGSGTGLGLSISFGIIEKHHGKIAVVSEPGEGSEFIITLPITQSSFVK